MTQLPRFLSGDRIFDAVALPLLSILQACLMATGVIATRTAFGALHSGTSVPTVTLVSLFGATSLFVTLEVARKVSAERIGQSYANCLRKTLYQQIARMPKPVIDNRRLGALSLRFVGDLSAARNWYGKGFPRMVAAGIILPGAGAVVWHLDPRIALVSCAILLVTLLAMAVAAVGFDMLHRNLRGRRSAIAIAMMERIAVAPQLDLMGRTPREIESLDTHGEQLRVNAAAHAARAGLLLAIPQIGLSAAGISTLLLAPGSDATAGTVAAILAMLAILTLPLRDAARAWDQFSAWRIARAKALVLLQGETRAEPSPGHNVPRPEITIPARSAGILRGGTLRTRSDLALAISGLDRTGEIGVAFDPNPTPKLATHYIGEAPLALQGSMRRAFTLGISPRPPSRDIIRMSRLFGLDALLTEGSRSLRRRISEGARDLTAAEGFRMELVRAALADPDLIVIDTARLDADPDREFLLETLAAQTTGSVLIVSREILGSDPVRFEPLPLKRAEA